MSTGYGPKISTNGLILYLDSRNTKSYPGTGSLWYDLTGNGYTFNIGGGTYSNGCLNYNGGNSTAYENVTNSVPAATTYNDWTMEVFCKPTSLQDTTSNCIGPYPVSLFSNAGASNNIYYGYNVGWSTSGSDTRLNFGATFNVTTAQNMFGIYTKTANQKVLVTAQYSYNSSTNTPTLFLYIDGNLLVSTSYNNVGDLINTQHQFRVAGRVNNCTNGSFIGEFYSFKYYNRLLSFNEIKQNAIAAGLS